jgi:hypothetical protein
MEVLMQARRNTSTQQSNVPIPLAAMVIDIRSGKDDLLKMLRLEIENLASEKQEHRVNHWQYLADFIDFQSVPPLDPQEVKGLWKRIEKDRNAVEDSTSMASVDANGSLNNDDSNNQQGLSMQWQEPYLPFNRKVEDEDDVLPDTSMLAEEYQDCTHRIDLIRNKRHNALSDLGKTGRLGKNKKYARTHVIFITDSRDRDSLNSASVFAAYLKQYYRGHLEHSGYEDVLVTSVISMNHPNTAEAPRLLINNLRWAGKEDDWEHINVLIINEAYRADAGWQDAETQSYVTELLLYSLLIVEPIELYRIPQVPLNTPKAMSYEQQVKERRELHPQTFIFGLSTIEHSIRWGRLYLNTTLAAQTMQILHLQSTDNRGDIDSIAQTWFDNWRQDVGKAVPQDIPGDFPYRQVLDSASKAARPSSEVFPENDSRHNIEQRSIDIINNYADQLEKTYRPLQQDQSQTIVHAMNRLREKDESNRLVTALKRSQRVLSEFFSGATGSIARAKLQLEALSDVIAQYNRDRKSINFDDMRNDILRLKNERIQAFSDHCSDFPFLRDHPLLFRIAIVIILLLCAFTGIVIALAGYVAFHHLVSTQFPSIASLLDSQLFGASYITLGNIILVLLVVVILLLAVYIPYRLIFRPGGRSRNARRRGTSSVAGDTSWETEIILVGTLIVFAIFSFIVTLMLTDFANDPVSLSGLAWLSGLPFWGWLALVVALVCVVSELIHYFVWYRELLDLRVRAIEDLQKQHQRNIDMINQHLGDTVALDLLRRAGLTDGQGGRGPYYKRVAQLNTGLANIEKEIEDQLKVVSNRLLEQQVTLHFRKELLDVKELTALSQKLTDELTHEESDLQEFAEVLLRVMGEEVPAELEILLRDERVSGGAQQFWRPSYLDRRALRHIQVLTEIIAAVALRIVIEIPHYDAITPLDRRFREISDVDPDYQIALKTLIERIQNYNKDTILNNLRGQPISQDDYENQLILQALTLWAQIFWIHKDNELDDLLKSQDIFVVLKQQGYAPQTIRDLLGVRVNPGGRPRVTGWNGEPYLIAPPSPDGFKYILGMDHRLNREMIYDSPDMERFIMLFLHRYPALPLLIPQDTPALSMPQQPSLAAPASPHGASNNIQPTLNEDDVAQSASSSLGDASSGAIEPSASSPSPLANVANDDDEA